jgi:hypothetical protein
MVHGLEIFRDYFQNCLEQYVLIGGTACDLLMSDAGFEFRVTKDLDMVLFIEVLDSSFFQIFWKFIREGEYQEGNESKNRCSYRFQKPKKVEFPKMIELFSRKPDFVDMKEHNRLIRIHTEEDISGLSAILMDESYYQLCLNGKIQKSGLSILRTEHLIPLKAKAWLDLSQQKADSGDIRKHRNDVFKLFQIVDPDYSITLPTVIQNDLWRFVESMKTEPFDIKSIDIVTPKTALIKDMVKYYKL